MIVRPAPITVIALFSLLREAGRRRKESAARRLREVPSHILGTLPHLDCSRSHGVRCESLCEKLAGGVVVWRFLLPY
jgi:hypothetical protein